MSGAKLDARPGAKLGARPGAWQIEPEAAMKCPMDQDPVSVETIAATIAASPIVVTPPVTLLPAGFEDVDLAILSWLAGEAARMRSRSFALMQ
jgi:hypothetical protein